MNIFKKLFFQFYFLLVIGNVNADKIRIGTEVAYLHGTQKTKQVS